MKKLLTVALMALALTSCISSKARDEVLLPAAKLAWVGVRADLVRGIEDAIEDGDVVNVTVIYGLVDQLDEVLELGGSRILLRQIPWESTLRPYAARGIQDRVDDGEITQMIADLSYTERLNQFSLALEQLRVAIVIYPPSTSKEYWLPNGGGRVTDQAAVAVATTN